MKKPSVKQHLLYHSLILYLNGNNINYVLYFDMFTT